VSSSGHEQFHPLPSSIAIIVANKATVIN
jgi:hypothetical protein